MAVIKCKMCGGDLDVKDGYSVCECEYCGSKQTVPCADSEKKMTLFARANRLRLANEFDKAAGVYETVVSEYPEEAEAYWGLVLCRYGIEYVDDPATGKKTPTCHRSSFDSVMDDPDFDQACENADAIARRQYREEAKQIEEIRRGIIEVSGREAPYDIFICYKETDENGERTIDSVIAQDVYDALAEKGYRVFFSRISLEDKLGTEYEPYIFAALNSAKVMLAFGTDYEYYNAVWVKNEWSRFLKLMERDKSKHLIPCYKSIDAYDMPREFQRLQGQDMSKVGAVQDLLRGIEKLLPRKTEASAQPHVVQQVVQSGGPNVTALMQRGNMALEDSEWSKAKAFFDQVLNMDAQCAEAHLGMAMADTMFRNDSEIASLDDQRRFENFTSNSSYRRFLRFADTTQKTRIELLIQQAKPIIAERTAREQKEAAERAERERREAVERAEHAEREKREAAERAERERKEVAEREKRARNLREVKRLVVAKGKRTIGMCLDGSIISTEKSIYGEYSIPELRQVVAIAAGVSHTVGLRKDGTVVASGKNNLWECNVREWRKIVSISAGDAYTVGLKSDGTVVATGANDKGQCAVSGWHTIVAVAAGYTHTIGLRSNGTVVAVGYNSEGQCDVSGWTNITAISAGSCHSVGLRADGTVIAVGYNGKGQCDVSDWHDIVAIAAGDHHTVGLRADGTVVATGNNDHRQCFVCSWENVVAIAAGGYHTVGLRTDGTVIAVGANQYGQCGVLGWKLFNNIDMLDEERNGARNKRIAVLEEEREFTIAEMGELKGLFVSVKMKQLKQHLTEVERELEDLKKQN